MSDLEYDPHLYEGQLDHRGDLTPGDEPEESAGHWVRNYLVGLGFNEIFTNSITNQAFYSEDELRSAVKMLNSLSAELNMMRPSFTPPATPARGPRGT